MTTAMPVRHKQSGFTLVEAIIYIALFSILFTGLFVSIFPLFMGAERLTENVAADSESAFILSKINFAINDTLTSANATSTLPNAHELVLSQNGTEKYRFTTATTGCVPGPIICRLLTLRKDGGTTEPLNGSRVRINTFNVTKVGRQGTAPAYLDVTLVANDATTTARYYLRF